MKVGLAIGKALIRESLRSLLQNEGVQVAWQVSFAYEARQREAVQILVADLVLPDRFGLDLARDLRCHNPALRTLLLVNRLEELQRLRPEPDPDRVGYLPVSASASDLFSAFEAIRRGQAYTHPDTDLVLGRQHRNGLTPCERRILELLSRGLPTTTVKTTLQVSPNTLKTHLKGIYRKLGVAGRTQAVVEGMRLGLVGRPGP